jgi:hypothetical protein
LFHPPAQRLAVIKITETRRMRLFLPMNSSFSMK